MDRDGLSGKFARLIEPAGPYETSPVVCVAVSGGGDSMALVLLMDRWARARGGRVVGLSVDHRLRDGSANEARQVGTWLSRRNIEHHILDWRDPNDASALQENARIARYDLMEQWCRDHGILHLFLAHNAEDQAETFLMRLNKGSGPDGLSAMSVVTERQHCRFVRPLLSVSGKILRRFLKDQGQGWIEDPSNQNSRFERIRWRQMMVEQNLSADGFCHAAERYGRVRTVLDRETARLSARSVFVHPAGFIRLHRPSLYAAPVELSERVLARSLMVVGGALYPPRRHKLERLMEAVRGQEETSRTLGGCLIEQADGQVQISRELRALPGPLPVNVGMRLTWDRRFRLNIIGTARQSSTPLYVQPLGVQGDRDVRSFSSESGGGTLPRSVRLSLPTLVDADGILCVPHLAYSRRGENRQHGLNDAQISEMAFRSLNSLSGSGYFVAY